MKILLSITITLLCTGQAFGQQCPVNSGFRGTRYSIDRYKNGELIKTVHTLQDIAIPIRNRLNAHLKSKLGDVFSRRLKFGWGYWVDLERLKRESPDVYEWNAPMGSYDLVFWFSDPKKGLKALYSKIILNDDGTIREDINLPNIAANPEKALIIPCRKAVSIAVNQGFPKQALHIKFGYSPEQHSFVWIITDVTGTEPDDPLAVKGQGTYKNIQIDANTGLVLRIYKETIIM